MIKTLFYHFKHMFKLNQLHSFVCIIVILDMLHA